MAGWVVSKADRIFDLWVDPFWGPLMLDPTFSLRTMLWLTSFLLAATMTYISREYFWSDRSPTVSSSVAGRELVSRRSRQ